MKKLATIEKWLNSDEFNRKEYGRRIYKMLDKIYNRLVGNKELMDVVKCQYNDKRDVYDFFDVKLADAVIMVPDFDIMKEFEIYNVLCDDKKFFKDWSRDLFDLIYKRFRID